MNDALMKNYDTMVLKDSVSVIHAAFGDTPHVVAMVSVIIHYSKACDLTRPGQGPANSEMK